MSADNGYVIVKENDGFYVYMYFASDPFEDKYWSLKSKYHYLDSALEYASSQLSEYGVRYVDRTK